MAQKANLTKQEAGEMAAEYMYHFMCEELGSSHEDGVNAASSIYEYFTGEEIDVEELLGYN